MVSKPSQGIPLKTEDNPLYIKYLPIFISIIAFVVSVIALVLQYRVTISSKYRVNNSTVVSLAPKAGERRQMIFDLNVSIFNLGNRPIAIENISLRIKEEGMSKLQKNLSNDCNGLAYTLTPVTSKFNLTSEEPFVVAKEDIVSRDIAFEVFHFDELAKTAIAGLVCLYIRASDVNGDVYNTQLAIGIVELHMDRPNDTGTIQHIPYPSIGVMNKLMN